ncbi:hypothetical protein HBB16_14480 [Pseudonocardia sp. MCCB 268]|nr:hypothetical protein [Pseudonocardia cytotoxica]
MSRRIRRPGRMPEVSEEVHPCFAPGTGGLVLLAVSALLVGRRGPGQPRTGQLTAAIIHRPLAGPDPFPSCAATPARRPWPPGRHHPELPAVRDEPPRPFQVFPGGAARPLTPRRRCARHGRGKFSFTTQEPRHPPGVVRMRSPLALRTSVEEDQVRSTSNPAFRNLRTSRAATPRSTTRAAAWQARAPPAGSRSVLCRPDPGRGSRSSIDRRHRQKTAISGWPRPGGRVPDRVLGLWDPGALPGVRRQPGRVADRHRSKAKPARR